MIIALVSWVLRSDVVRTVLKSVFRDPTRDTVFTVGPITVKVGDTVVDISDKNWAKQPSQAEIEAAAIEAWRKAYRQRHGNDVRDEPAERDNIEKPNGLQDRKTDE